MPECNRSQTPSIMFQSGEVTILMEILTFPLSFFEFCLNFPAFLRQIHGSTKKISAAVPRRTNCPWLSLKRRTIPKQKLLICNLANENGYVCRVFFHRPKGNAVGGALNWASFPLLDLVFRAACPAPNIIVDDLHRSYSNTRRPRRNLLRTAGSGPISSMLLTRPQTLRSQLELTLVRS